MVIAQPKFRFPMRKPEFINRELGFGFSNVEMERVVEDLKFELMMKFLSKRPSIDVLCLKMIQMWVFKEVPIVSSIDDFHVLLHLASEIDYLHA